MYLELVKDVNVVCQLLMISSIDTGKNLTDSLFYPSTHIYSQVRKLVVAFLSEYGIELSDGSPAAIIDEVRFPCQKSFFWYRLKLVH